MWAPSAKPLANALVHRDYHRLGAVHVRLDDEGLTPEQPGGLRTVTLANLRPPNRAQCNRTLADVTARRHGGAPGPWRGQDLPRMLRFGRPELDYWRAPAPPTWVLRLATVDADEAPEAGGWSRRAAGPRAAYRQA